MPAYKDAQKGTWYAAFYYQDWKGVKKKKLKRGFPTKKEALAWERTFLLQQAADLTMTFEAFVEIYEKCLAGGDIVVLKHNQEPKYLSYVLATTDARQQKSKGKVKSKVVHSSVPAIREIKVPIPPIEIQCEIVRILDDYTENIVELQNQLTAEITARQKQYEFYRDKLLTFDVLRGGQLIFDGGCSAKSQTLVQVIAIRTRRWKMANIRFLFVLRNRCEKTILSMHCMRACFKQKNKNKLQNVFMQL